MTLSVVAVMLTTLLGFTALAVDVANGYVARAILQHAVDDGALTAQRWSTQADDPGADPSAVQTQAVAAALETARRDIDAQGLAGAAAVEAVVAGSRLRIAARASIRTWFLRPFGVATLAPSASADTVLWTAVSSASPSARGAAAGGPAPALPPAIRPAPAVILPEAPGGAQPGDAPAGPPSGEFPGAADAPGPPGGDIAEGP